VIVRVVAIVSTIAVFLPVYLFVVVPGPFFRRYEEHPRLRGFVKGATAAASGAIAGVAIVIADQTLGGLLSVGIGLVALALMVAPRVRMREPLVVALAAVAGLALHG
jgi:chromate transporter